LSFATCARAGAATTVVAQQGDASISHDEAAGAWTLAAGGASLTLALDPARDFAILSLVSASGASWTTGAAADSFVRVDNKRLAFGSRVAGFAYQRAVSVPRATLQLDATFRFDADDPRSRGTTRSCPARRRSKRGPPTRGRARRSTISTPSRSRSRHSPSAG
jgi:hypothetical protein